MGTPLSPEMKVLRTKKIDEYFIGFQNLREDLYRKGLEESYIDDLIKQRSRATGIVMDMVNTYVANFNEYTKGHFDLDTDTMFKAFFNLINLKIGINSTDKAKNRRDRDAILQIDILFLEANVFTSIKNREGLFPKEYIRLLYRVLFNEHMDLSRKELNVIISNRLEEYNSNYLFDNLADDPSYNLV